MVETATPHIRVDERGVAYIGKTRSQVKQVILSKIAGMDAEAIHSAYPHLSLAEIYAAFSFYYDHKDQMDTEIARDRQEMETNRSQTGETVTRADLLDRLRNGMPGR